MQNIMLMQSDYIDRLTDAYAQGVTHGICTGVQIKRFSPKSFWGREVEKATSEFRQGLTATLAAAQPEPTTAQ